MEQPLFRREAQARPSQLLGSVNIALPPSFYVMSALLAVTTALIGAFLMWGTYARKHRVQGILVPTRGVVKVIPPSGVVTETYVVEGDSVEAGELLFAIHQPRLLLGGAEAADRSVAIIEQQLSTLRASRSRTLEKFALEQSRLLQRRATISEELETVSSQLGILRARTALANDRAGSTRTLHLAGFSSRRDYDAAAGTVLALEQEEKQLEARRVSVRGQERETAVALEELPGRRLEALEQIEAAIAAHEQQMIEHELRRIQEVRAPVAGTVTSVVVVAGAPIVPQVPALSILPRGAELEAHLFVPTRASGFISVGQKVNMRYDAFPYQQFGVHEGQIRERSRSVQLPHELSLVIQVNEPVYRVKVRIDTQVVSAYGQNHALRAGMALEADIILSERSLVEWILDPIYSLTGRVGA